METSPERTQKGKLGLILVAVILVSLISFASAWPLDDECTNDVLDIAIIIDSSESAQYEWNTLCDFKSELLDDLDDATDAKLTFYKIGNSFTAEIPANCDDATAFWGDDKTSYDWEQRRDERGEFWAPAAQDVIDKHDWRDNSQKLIIIVSDSDPTGLQEGSGVGTYQAYGWRYHSTGKHSEGEILRRTRDAANDNGVTISVAGAKNIEVCHKVWWGDDNVCNIYEAFDMIASQTGGTYLSHGRSDADDVKTDIQDIIQDFYKCEKPEKPDLFIDNGNLWGAPVYDDELVNIEFKTHNDKEQRPAVPVEVYLDGTELTFPTTLPFFGPTAQWSIDLGILPAGQHALEIVTDPANTIKESNEGNNYFTYDFEILERPCPPEKPDLFIDGGYQTDSEIYDDEDADVRFMMHNTGDDDLTVTMQISLNGDTVPIIQMPFNSGSRDWGVGLGQLPAGSYTLEIITDSNDNVDESNENNNVFTYDFEVLERIIPPEPKPDLYIDNGAVWCPPVRECEIAVVFFDTHNDDDPISHVDVGVYLDGTKISAPGALPFTEQTLRKNINFGILPVGQHTLEIITDPSDTIKESNENNNIFTFDFEVLACPQPPVDEKIDLSIGGGYLPRPTILDNESAEVRFLRQNTGDDSLVVPIQISLNGDVITQIPTMAFPSGVTDWGVGLGELEAGNYTLEIITDSDDSFDESNETNNLFTFDFEVTNTTLPPEPPVDDEAPIITIISPEDREYNVSDVLYHIATDEPVTRGWFNLNGSSNTTMSFMVSDNQSLYFQQQNLSNGDYTITFYAEDAAGNIGSNSTTFSINVTEEEKKEDDDKKRRGHREESVSINLNPQSGIGLQDVTISPKSAVTLGMPASETLSGSSWWIWILVLLAAIVILTIIILLIVA